MATITFDEVSTELASQRQEVPSLLPPSTDGGRVRVKRFSYTATGAVTSGSQIELVEITGAAVVLDTVIDTISLSNSATAQIGHTLKSAPEDGNADALLAATTAAAESAPGEKNIDLPVGVNSIFATTGVGALAANDTLSGYVLYVLNT